MSRTTPEPSEYEADATSTAPLTHVLICDDDHELRQLLATFLGEHDFKVTLAADGRELQRQFRANPSVDLVILDVMLPGTSGLELCRKLRAASTVPILMLTARGEETDRIVGLEMGADDYMSKPFGPNELLARIKALLRRARMSSGAEPGDRKRWFEFDGWRLDSARRELRNPKGVIIFSKEGQFALIQMQSELPRIAANSRDLGTPEENKAIVQGSIAYFGTYAVNEGDKTLTLKLEGSTYANLLAAGEQKRLITSLTADELKFTNPRTPSGVTLEVSLRRAK